MAGNNLSLDSLVAVEGESFEPRVVWERIKCATKKRTPIFKGDVLMGEVDIVRCTRFASWANEKQGIGLTFIDEELDRAAAIIERYGGHYVGTSGDALTYIFGEDKLEEILRCTVDIKKWVDRELTNKVLDYVIAHQLLKEAGEFTGEIEQDESRTLEKRDTLQQIKNLWGDAVPMERRKEREDYERLYGELSQIMQRLYSEMRLASRGGVVPGKLDLRVAIRDGVKTPNYGGGIRYRLQRVMGKEGPMGRGSPIQYQKDVVMVLSPDELEPPPHFTWKHWGLFGGERLGIFDESGEEAEKPMHLAQTWGPDCFRHPTFDGRLPANSPMVEKLDQYRAEVLAAREKLRAIEDENMHREACDWVDFTERRTDRPHPPGKAEEARHFHKLMRTLMASTYIPAVIDQAIQLYERASREADQAYGRDGELAYLRDPRNNRELREFIRKISDAEERQHFIIAGLVWSNGGILLRNNSSTPADPTRPLSPDVNRDRIVGERNRCYASVLNYPKLVEWGVARRIDVQHLPVSEISDEVLAMDVIAARGGLRIAHYVGGRSWQAPKTPQEALECLLRSNSPVDFADLISEGRFTNSNYQFVFHALANTLNLPLPYSQK